MPYNRCIRIYDLKQKVQYHPEIGTYVSEEDIDLADRVFCYEESAQNCSSCKNGTYRKSIYQANGDLIRRANFCDECGRDLRRL